MRLGTRSGRSRFNGVPGRAMEQVKGEGRAEAPGPLGHRPRSGRGWRSGAGPGAVRGGRAAVWGRPSSGGGEGVRAAAHRAGGEQCGEAGLRGAPGPLSVRRLPARRGGPGGRREFGLSPTRGGKRGRVWAPEASREVALGSAEGGGGNTVGGAGRDGGGRGASVEAGGPGPHWGTSQLGERGLPTEKPPGTWPQLTWRNAGTRDGNTLEVASWGKYYSSESGRVGMEQP